MAVSEHHNRVVLIKFLAVGNQPHDFNFGVFKWNKLIKLALSGVDPQSSLRAGFVLNWKVKIEVALSNE